MAQVCIDSSIEIAFWDIDSELSHHMNRFECYDQNERDIFFSRHASCVCCDDSDSQYKTVDVDATSVVDDGMDHYHRT